MKARNGSVPFELSEYKRRLENVRANMEKDGLDVALITSPADNTYLTA